MKRMDQMASDIVNTNIGDSSFSSEISSQKRSLLTEEEGFVGKKFRSIHKASLQSADDIKVA